MKQEQLLDRSQLNIQPAESRTSDIELTDVWEAGARRLSEDPERKLTDDAVRNIGELAKKVAEARANDRGVFIFMGGHLIKLGLSRNIIDLIINDVVTHVAMNGACLVHEHELSGSLGKTSENVAQNIKDGEFGLWSSMDQLNYDVRYHYTHLHDPYNPTDSDTFSLRMLWKAGDPDSDTFSLAEAVGCSLHNGRRKASPRRVLSWGSILAAGVDLRNDCTTSAHILIGGDINHMHASFDADTWAHGSHNDFLLLAEQIRLHLGDGGVFINIGSAVHGPEIFLKALSMARNISPVDNFHTAVLDIQQVQGGWWHEPKVKTDPAYYFRPWKTILSRSLSGTGKSYYIQGHFVESIPRLRNAIVQEMSNDG